jgi:DNA-binding LytR/AlgR family response regulator
LARPCTRFTQASKTTMQASKAPTALIAEDEPLLAASLQAALQQAWPALQIVSVVGDGVSAVDQALRLLPTFLFLDIRMPGLNGLDAATAIASDWPEHLPLPALVFVTAYDHYAVQAFEVQAFDYVLKPVTPERLERTVRRLQERHLQIPGGIADADDTLAHGLAQLQALLSTGQVGQPMLKVIQASVGSTIHMVPVEEVVMFEAADKYVRVLTVSREYLIRTPLKELMPQLNAEDFWQVHRGTVVKASAIETVHRDDAGKWSLRLHGRPASVPVSRLHAQRFRAM